MITMPTVNTSLEQMSWDLAGEFEDVFEERKYLSWKNSLNRKHKNARIHTTLTGTTGRDRTQTEEQEIQKQAALLTKFPMDWQRAMGYFTENDLEIVQKRFTNKAVRFNKKR